MHRPDVGVGEAPGRCCVSSKGGKESWSGREAALGVADRYAVFGTPRWAMSPESRSPAALLVCRSAATRVGNVVVSL